MVNSKLTEITTLIPGSFHNSETYMVGKDGNSILMERN